MILDCLRVRHRIQDRLDRGEGRLTDRDALHLQSCTRCGGLLRGYALFSRELRRQSGDAAGSEVPDWDAVFAAAGSAPAAVPAARDRGDRPLTRSLARWTPSLAARAALLAALLGLGAFVGYREYRSVSARRFVRSSTTEFVNTIFASSIFSASPETAPPQGIEADAGWFDATGVTPGLPQPPGADGGTAPPAP